MWECDPIELIYDIKHDSKIQIIGYASGLSGWTRCIGHWVTISDAINVVNRTGYDRTNELDWCVCADSLFVLFIDS